MAWNIGFPLVTEENFTILSIIMDICAKHISLAALQFFEVCLGSEMSGHITCEANTPASVQRI